MENSQYLNLFPDAIEGTLFSFGSSYESETDLTHGTGYWLRFPDQGMNQLFGIELNSVTIALNENWNLISGITNPTSIYLIGDPNSIIIPGTFYGFNESYELTEVLEPGKGYWVRSSGGGEITLSASARATTKMVVVQKPKNLNTLKFGKQSLYFGNTNEVENTLSYSLPPKPPLGAKDIRFAGDTKLCTTGECVIEVMNSGHPLLVECDIKNGEIWELVDESGKVFVCEGVQVLEQRSVSDTFILRKSTTTVPAVFALLPAYPNPFNPVTTIQFSIPIVQTRHAVSLQIYDITGKLVGTLMDEELRPGHHTIQWNASGLSSGIYFVRLQSGDFSKSQKLILLK